MAFLLAGCFLADRSIDLTFRLLKLLLLRASESSTALSSFAADSFLSWTVVANRILQLLLFECLFMGLFLRDRNGDLELDSDDSLSLLVCNLR